jgi:hypothetical protein
MSSSGLSLASALVLIDDGEVAGELHHGVSVATMRRRRKKAPRWVESVLVWAGLATGLRWWASLRAARPGKPGKSFSPLFFFCLIFLFCFSILIQI